MTRYGWESYAMLALVLSWPVMAVLGVLLVATGSPWFGLSVGYCTAFAWGAAKLARELYRHGLDNHCCGNDCCRFDR